MGNENEKTDLEVLDEVGVNLSESVLFMCVMKNMEAYENILSIIMDDLKLQLTEVHVEDVVPNKEGRRSIRLDAKALDDRKRHYNVEMQNDTSGQSRDSGERCTDCKTCRDC